MGDVSVIFDLFLQCEFFKNNLKLQFKEFNLEHSLFLLYTNKLLQDVTPLHSNSLSKHPKQFETTFDLHLKWYRTYVNCPTTVYFTLPTFPIGFANFTKTLNDDS